MLRDPWKLFTTAALKVGDSEQVFKSDSITNLTEEKLARLRDRFKAFSGEIFGEAYDATEAMLQLRSDALTLAHHMDAREIGLFMAHLTAEMKQVTK